MIEAILQMKKYRNRTTRLLFFLCTDILIIFLAVWLAFLLRFDGTIPGQFHIALWVIPAVSALSIIPIFYLQGLYTFSWSYVSTQELVSLFKSLLVSFLVTVPLLLLAMDFYRVIIFPRSIVVMSYFLIFLASGSFRFAKRIYLYLFGSHAAGKERVLIVGAGDAGEQIARSILRLQNSPYLPIGFLDDNHIKKNITIHGLPVLGTIAQMRDVVMENQIKQLIIALPSVSSAIIKDAVDFGRKSGIKKIKISPPISEIIGGQISFEQLKEVQIEDLLGRDPARLDKEQVQKLVHNNTVLITGAAGSIGSELSHQVAICNPSLLVLLDQDETGMFHISKELEKKFPNVKLQPLVADIADTAKIQSIFTKFAPKIVFHAAAYKHVPLMEQHPDEAVKNNVFGTETVAVASVNAGVEKFIFISTDKAVNPTSVMGATKRMGEMMCQVLNLQNRTKFISVRFGNVLNSRGSVIPIFKDQIKKGGPVEVTHPQMQRYFMLNSEACLLVMQAAAMGQGGEVFVLDMGKPIKILDLAKEMIRLSGFEYDKDIPIVFVGPRPGEKLFEEILTAEEGVLSTSHEKIFKAKLSDIDRNSFLTQKEILQQHLQHRDPKALLGQLKAMVPFFKYN